MKNRRIIDVGHLVVRLLLWWTCISLASCCSRSLPVASFIIAPTRTNRSHHHSPSLLFHHFRLGRVCSSSSSSSSSLTAHNDVNDIAYQSDVTKYGRGERHLSATLDRGDVIVYQTGTWYVDGVAVGEGSAPGVAYGVVETIQLVWTHNCEHGVIRVLPVQVVVDDNKHDNNNNDNPQTLLQVQPDEDFLEVGPEQLIAKLPVQWNQEQESKNPIKIVCPFPIPNDLWSLMEE